FVERGIHFVENAERARLKAEDGDEQGKRRERLFAAGEKQNVLQALAGGLRDDVNARFAGAIRFAESHFAVAAAEERVESDGELLVDESEGFLELQARHLIELGDRELGILDGLHQIVALAAQEFLALLAFL